MLQVLTKTLSGTGLLVALGALLSTAALAQYTTPGAAGTVPGSTGVPSTGPAGAPAGSIPGSTAPGTVPGIAPNPSTTLPAAPGTVNSVPGIAPNPATTLPGTVPGTVNPAPGITPNSTVPGSQGGIYSPGTARPGTVTPTPGAPGNRPPGSSSISPR